MKQLTFTKEETGSWPCLVLDFGHDVNCISLHGDGERGTDLNSVLKVGPQKFATDKPTILGVNGGYDYGVNFICPQAPAGAAFWRGMMKKFLEWFHKLDMGGQIGLTGISMGGNWTWENAQTYPWLFMAPVAGRPEQPKNVWEPYVPLREDCKIYAAHSPHDKKVSWQKEKALIDLLQIKFGTEFVKYEIYDNIHDHNVWDEFYKPGGEFDMWLKGIINIDAEVVDPERQLVYDEGVKDGYNSAIQDLINQLEKMKK